MSESKLGMCYSDVAKRIKRIKSSPMHPQSKLNLIHSLSNQCRLAEGESSIKELAHECAFKKTDSTFSGAGNKQTGACFKFDCSNRDKFCDECFRGSAYSKKTLMGPALTHKSAGNGGSNG